MDLQIGDKVELVVEKETALGYVVLINEEFEGLLYRNEVFRDVEVDMEIDGYIKNIREDGKIDVSLKPQGFDNVIKSDAQNVLDKIESSREGYLLLTDKSSPEAIKFQMQMSKKAFKKAIGNLYRRKRIVILEDRIELAPNRK